MRERAAVYGGTLRTGARPGGGFEVEASIPAARGGAVTISVLIADDQALVRSGLRAIIESEPGMEVVGEAATAPRRSRPCGGCVPTSR